MACELHHDAAWPALLAMRQRLAERIGACFLAAHHGIWTCLDGTDPRLATADEVLVVPDPRDEKVPAEPPHRGAWSRFVWQPDCPSQYVHPNGSPITPGVQLFARVYLPVLLGAVAARARSSTFVVAHVTQSLDGRIACLNGQSQWIGNDADLRHSHRMRALVDAVVVGANTALTDNPRLTVRHVTGPAPRRIVLSGSARVFRSDLALHLFDATGCEVVLADDADATTAPATARLVRIRRAADGQLAPAAILRALQWRGVHSLYLEGGAAALSSFLQAHCLDLLQVHIAAMVLGSGLPAFVLPPVDHVGHGRQFTADHAMLDGHLLLSCWPGPRSAAAP